MAGPAGIGTSAKLVGFDELQTASAAFAKTQERLLRLNIYNAAKTVVGYVRTAVTAGSYETDAGMREGIAKGLQVQVDTSSLHPGAAITATADAMPAGKAPMVAAWAKTTFRHPVFGNADVLVDQPGNPGFLTKTVAAHKDKIDRAVTEAMAAAVATLAGGKA